MYKTKVPLAPSGGELHLVGFHLILPVFQGNMVVSMRPYAAHDLERVREITRPYIATHGEPFAWVSTNPLTR
jgi:uncharacterized protein YcsI (UPF0317 family)